MSPSPLSLNLSLSPGLVDRAIAEAEDIFSLSFFLSLSLLLFIVLSQHALLISDLILF